jgi:hypothetical protein
MRESQKTTWLLETAEQLQFKSLQRLEPKTSGAVNRVGKFGIDY